MKRRTIFAGLAAALGMNGQSGIFRAKPDICPVCGEKAEPYVRKTEMEYYGSDTCLSSVSIDGRIIYPICRTPSTTEKAGPMERIIRCKQCNAAFWQDAEDRPV